MEEPQKILILSSDQDNLQLQKHSNVKQYSPMQKKFVKPETSAANSLMEKLCTGDAGDGIPNIMSGDNFLADGIRQKPFKKDRLEEFYKLGRDACKTDEERRNFDRNKLLVSYDMIPAGLVEEILTTYKTQAPVKSPAKIMQYLARHRCRNLLDDIESF